MHWLIIIFSFLFVLPAYSDQSQDLASNQHQGSGKIHHNQIELTEEEKAFLESHPVIRLGTDETWEPFVSRGKDGILRGVDVDFVRYINESTGSNIQLVAGQWADMVKKAKSREIEGLVTSAPLKAREPFFNFSEVYVSEFMLVIVPFDSSLEIKDISDLSGRTVAIQKGNEAYAALLKPYPSIKVIEAESDIESTKMVVEGKADASITGTSSYKTVHRRFLQSIKIGYVVSEKPLDLVFSIRKDWPELVTIINKGLASIPQEKVNAIYLRWLGMNPPGPGVKGKPSIRTIIVDNYYPYTFINENGEPDGFSVDLVRAVAKVMGFEIRINADTWEQARNGLKTGEIDFLPMMAYSKERDKEFDFSAPHTIAYDAFFTRKDSPEIRSINDLRQKKIIVMKNDQAHDYLSSLDYIKHDQLIFTNNLQDSLRMLSAGKGDAALMPKLVGLIFIKKLNLTNLALSPLVIEEYKRPFSIAVNEGNQELLERLNQGLSILKETDQRKEIFEKWFGIYESSEISFIDVLKYFFWILLGFILIGAVLFVWFLSLKKQVSIRTKDLKDEIEERQRAEEALRGSQERLKGIFESIPSPIVVYNTEGHPLYLNSAFTKLFSWSLEELKGQPIPFVPDDQKELSSRKIGEVYKTGKVVRYETKRLTKQGDVLDVILSGAFVKGPDGDPAEMVAILTNITDLKQAEEALRGSEEKYRTVLESNPDPVVVYDIEGRVIYLNPAFRRVFGWSLEEQKGKKLENFVPEENWPETKMMINKVTVLGESFSGLETRRNTKDGNVLDIGISGSCYRDREGNVAASVINLRDITEQKKIEAQLQQAQKMEAIGTLSSGVAHDFNNLLMAIQGRISTMLMDKDASDPNFEHLRGIEDHVESAASLTTQLLGFAMGGKYEVKPTDLNEFIEKQNRIFGRTRKETIIKSKYQENLWSVEIDQGQIEQVLLNLYVNAWQAMPGGGELHLETANVTLDEEYVKPFATEPGRYVKISVSDTGVGMDKEILERIFDPFFTTKEMGRGTGLGLASAYGIIKNHGGFINVYSERDNGSIFNIYLPASIKEVIEEEKPSGGTLKGSETVLFVDDEDMIIEVAEELLKRLGYMVLTAGSGKEALKIYEENSQQIDLVVLDMIMPNMGGGDTYDGLKTLNSKVKVLLSSGYSISGQATEILDRGCSGFIQKPFRVKEFSQKLREILDKE